MGKRRQINADPDQPTLRSSVAAATEPVRDAAFKVEQNVWKGAERLRGPIERIAWPFERFVLWPLQDRVGGLGPSLGAGGVAAVLAIVAGVALLGFTLSSDDGGGEPPRLALDAAPAVAPAPPATPETPAGNVLHGAAPSFDVGSGVGVAAAPAEGGGDEAVSVGSGDATSTFGEEAAAGASSTEPVPAGPAAMKVARRFAEAFVFYEIGERPERAEAVFADTASPALSEALSERPPRLPSSGEVPKAKVLNLVPGPRSGRAYTVSVSLLRVGLTSELRLELKKDAGTWTVTDVRG